MKRAAATERRSRSQPSTRDAERRRQIAEGLRDLLAVVNSGRSLDEILRYVVTQAVQLLDGTAGALYLVEADGASDWTTMRAAHGLADDEVMPRLRIGSPVTGLAIARRRAIVCPDVAAGLESAPGAPRAVRLEEHRSHIRALKIVDEFDSPDDLRRMQRLAERYRTMVSVPLTVRDMAYGALTLFYPQAHDVSDEEIGLALAFGSQAGLVIENARLHGRADERLREIEALYRADEILHRSLRQIDVLQALVDVAADVLPADKTAMMIWDERHERLIVGALRGFSALAIPVINEAASSGLARQVALTGEPLVIEDAQADPRVARGLVDSEGICSFAHVPIRVGGDVFGVFTMNYCQPHLVTADELRLMLSLAQRAGLALQNAQLYEQAQQAAVLEERQRLARELHDAVTQTLFSASLIAEVLPRLGERRPEQVGPRLEELRRLNRGALAEMRALLLELRPSALTEVPFADLVRHLVDAANARGTADIELTMTGTPRPLAPDQQTSLYRLVQEALHNVSKHAEAAHASVRMDWTDDGLVVCIHDDGRGFEPRGVPAGHLGLRFMHERAAAIAAHLEIISAPGSGTRVEISLGIPEPAPAAPH